MMTQQRRQDTLSNNIANAQTPGYKQDQAMIRAFPELLIKRLSKETLPTTRQFTLPTDQQLGSINTGVYVQETIADHQQGAIHETGISTDLALINGEFPDETGGLFFGVQNGDGTIGYTRNGNFTVDGAGFLTTNQGHYVLNQAGEPIFTDGQTFQVNNDGVMTLAEGQIPLHIAYAANVNELVKEDGDLFQTDGEALVDARTIAGVTYSIEQRFLETSNVDEAQTMTEMMQAYRLFETNQRVLQMYDQSMDIAVNQVGRIN